jgi:hypothetical protein
MKIRSGFVSNSSTSSFIMLGFKVKYEEDLETKVDEFNERIANYVKLEHLSGDSDDTYLGKILLYESDEDGYISPKSISLDEVKKFEKGLDLHRYIFKGVFGYEMPELSIIGGSI